MARGGLCTPSLEPPNGGLIFCPNCGTYCVQIQWTVSIDLVDYCMNQDRGEPSWSWGPPSNDPTCSGWTTIAGCNNDTDWMLCDVDGGVTAVFQRFMYVQVQTLWPSGCDSEEYAEYEWLVNHGATNGTINQLNGAPYPGYPSHEAIQQAFSDYYDEPYPNWCDE